MDSLMALLIVAWIVFVVWLVWQLFLIVGDMAEDRGQDRSLWMWVSVFINPLGTMILLWIFCGPKCQFDRKA